MISFEFYRFRFHLRALDRVRQERALTRCAGHSAPVCTTALFQRFTGTCSSLVRRRPADRAAWWIGLGRLCFRVAHLDGLTIPPGADFYLDAHIFELRRSALAHFRAAIALLAERGVGRGRGRAELVRVEQPDVNDRAEVVSHGAELVSTMRPPALVPLDPGAEPVERVSVRFLTPIELKTAGSVSERPEFDILFRRLRDRISTLRQLYGAGPLEIDFRGMGERAAAIRLVRCELDWERPQRKSGHTGQVHSIGGFTGEAEFQGDLAEFLPWLRAARWVGVGRQTVWGKGDVRVISHEVRSGNQGRAAGREEGRTPGSSAALL